MIEFMHAHIEVLCESHYCATLMRACSELQAPFQQEERKTAQRLLGVAAQHARTSFLILAQTEVHLVAREMTNSDVQIVFVYLRMHRSVGVSVRGHPHMFRYVLRFAFIL
jgi:hypothetical protein